VNEVPIELRRLSPADAPLFREIRLEGLRHDPDAFASTFENESDQPLSFFADRLARSAVLGAFRGPELLGIAGFLVQQGPKHAHKGTLWGMYVRPAARREGVGRRLVEGVIDYARTQVELIDLRVINENPAARRLYAGLGFEEYGLEKRAAKYQGRYHDDVLMAKMLEPSPGPPSGDRGR
jgi:ribosomal protein S18 acetylase RimI-like enzyme